MSSPMDPSSPPGDDPARPDVDAVREAAAELDIEDDIAPIDFSVDLAVEDDDAALHEEDEIAEVGAPDGEAEADPYAGMSDVDAIQAAIAGAADDFGVASDEPVGDWPELTDLEADAADEDAAEPEDEDAQAAEPADDAEPLVMDDLDAMLAAAQSVEEERAGVPEPDRNIRDFTHRHGAFDEGIPRK